MKRRSRIYSFAAAVIFSATLALTGWPGHISRAEAAPTYLTSGTTWSVPADWNNYHNSIEVIGGGGGGDIDKTSGSHSSRYGAGGGGGGAYSLVTNATLPAGSSVTVQIGAAGGAAAAGGDTYVCNTNSGCTAITSGSVVVGAKGGTGAFHNTPGSGGQASASIGTAVDGGNGGAGGTGGNTTGGGGGGAGGPNGAGVSGVSGTGGTDGAGGAGDAGNGGTGGTAGGGVGGNGTEWDSTHGSGGGGGAGGSTGATGGNYGGGAGGANNTGGSGKQGLIIIQYTPEPVYNLTNYRWYADSASQDVTDAWPLGAGYDIAQNTALAAIPAASGPPVPAKTLRLRLNITISTNPLPANFEYFKLQYQSNPSGSVACSTSSGWTDVGAGGSGSIWRFATNSVTDGTPLTASRLSPASNALEVYIKSNPTALNPNSAAAGQTAEYDFNIQDNGAADNTPYLFRMVMTDAADSLLVPFGSYAACPALNTAPATSDLMRHGNFFQNNTEQGDFWAN